MLKLKLRFADTRSFVTRYRGTTATSNTFFTTKPKPSVSPSALSPSAPARSAPALQRPAPIPTQQSKLPRTNPALPGPSSKFRAQLHAPDRGPGPAARARVKPPDWARPAAP